MCNEYYPCCNRNSCHRCEPLNQCEITSLIDREKFAVLSYIDDGIPYATKVHVCHNQNNCNSEFTLSVAEGSRASRAICDNDTVTLYFEQCTRGTFTDATVVGKAKVENRCGCNCGCGCNETKIKVCPTCMSGRKFCIR